jgi:hypothetical protein
MRYDSYSGFNIRQYIQFIDSIYKKAAESLLDIPAAANSVKQQVFDIIMQDGYDLCLKIIEEEFNSKQWNESLCQNLICASIEYVIATELSGYNVIVPQFTDSVRWVGGWLESHNQPQQQQYNYTSQRNFVLDSGNKQQAINKYDYRGNQQVNINNHTPIPAYQPRTTHIVAQEPVKEVIKEVVKVVRIRINDSRTGVNSLSLDNIVSLTNTDTLQLGNFATSLRFRSEPTMVNYYSKHKTLVDEEDIEFLDRDMDSLSRAKTIEDVITAFSNIKDVNFVSWVSTKVSQQILAALEHWYNIIDLDAFPYLTQFVNCNNYLIKLEIDEAIADLVVNFVNNLFTKVSYNTVKVDDENSRINIIELYVKSTALLLPYRCYYVKNTSSIQCNYAETVETIEDMFQQVFQKIEDTAIYIDVFDTALTHYRVFRKGIKRNTPNNFYVEYVPN